MADTDMTPAGDAGSGSPEPVGTRLKQAREAAGLGLAQLSAATKIPTRMLVLIENGDFAALPARTYATGFTRTYARALGLDEVEYVDAVRTEMGMAGRVDPQPAATFEPGDPARVPTARLAWLAALGAVAVVIVGGVFLWSTYYAPAVTLPSLLPDETVTAEAQPAAAATYEAGLPTEAATTEAAISPVVVRPVPRRINPVRRPAPARIGGILPEGLAPPSPQAEASPQPQAQARPQPVSTGAN